MPDEAERREHIFRNMLYGIGITAITSEVARRSLYCSKDANGPGSAVLMPTQAGNIFFEESKHFFGGSGSTRTCKYCGAPDPSNLDTQIDRILETHAYNFIHPNNLTILKTMKFDVIIGNPPYQLKDGGHGASAKPLYHLFIQAANGLKPKYLSMIIPSRWFAGGKGLDAFREEMLKDTCISHLVDFPNASECFPDVEIKGGVCYFLRSSSHNGPCAVTTIMNGDKDTIIRRLDTSKTFVRFNKAIGIINKLQGLNYKSLDIQVSSSKPFGLRTYVVPDKTGNIKLYANKAVGYYDKQLITKSSHLVPLWKVLVSKGYGAGEGYPHQIIGTPILAEPNSACTETYIVVGAYNSELEARNLLNYLKTRFVRFLIALKKNTQDVTRDKYEFVPQLDMTKAWDDETLYKHFSITPAEREFIESLIKEME